MSFFDFSAEDLMVPKKLIFMGNVPVSMKILDFKEKGDNTKGFYLEVDCSILDGEHKGKQHKMYISRKNKKTLVSFLEMFAPVDDFVAKKVQFSSFIGKSFTCVPQPVQDYQGKQVQNIFSYAIIKDSPVQADTNFNVV